MVDFTALDESFAKALVKDYTFLHKFADSTGGRVPPTLDSLSRFLVVYMSNQSEVSVSTMQGFYNTAAWLLGETPEEVEKKVKTLFGAFNSLRSRLTGGSLDRAIELFLAEHDARDNREKLRAFAAWCEESEIVTLSHVTEDDAVKYLYYLRYEKIPQRTGRHKPSSEGLSVQSVDNHRRIVRRFMEWCVTNKMISENPFRGIPKLKTESDLDILFGRGVPA